MPDLGGPAVAVTGATGRIGGGVARLLAEQGVALRLVVRDPQRVPRLPGAKVVEAAHGDREAVERALHGVDTVLMVSAGEAADRVAQHLAFVDGAVAAGVRSVVYTSFLGASPSARFLLARDHAATEDALRARVPAWTFLRDGLYADVLPGLVGPDGVVRGPAGSGRVSAVARQDVVEVAAAVLRAPRQHDGRTYDLTGPQALGLAEIAEVLTAHLGRPVCYEQETHEQALASRAGSGPAWLVEAWVSTYTAIAAGELAVVSDDVPRVLGRPAGSVAQVLPPENASRCAPARRGP